MGKKRRVGAVAGWKLLVGLLVCWPMAGWGQGVGSDAERLQVVYDMYAGYRQRFPSVPEMSVPEAMALAGSDRVVFIDARRPAERVVSRLPGSVTPREFAAAPDTYNGKKLVAYCTIGYRSGLLAEELGRKELPVYNLRGGILAWTLEGGKVYDEHGPVRRLHVYGKKWDYAPAGFETVMFSLWEQLF